MYSWMAEGGGGGWRGSEWLYRGAHFKSALLTYEIHLQSNKDKVVRQN